MPNQQSEESSILIMGSKGSVRNLYILFDPYNQLNFYEQASLLMSLSKKSRDRNIITCLSIQNNF